MQLTEQWSMLTSGRRWSEEKNWWWIRREKAEEAEDDEENEDNDEKEAAGFQKHKEDVSKVQQAPITDCFHNFWH